MKRTRIESVAYATCLAVAGLSVAFLWAIEFGPKAVVSWWKQTPAVTA